jgi:Kef-type K+ transport system membrane component KefB/predicted amino acid-binding ACT domain protein
VILATAGGGVGAALLDLLVLLAVAKLAAEVAERVRVPPVLGEIVAGMAIGPSALGLVDGSDVLRVLAELGVILLLLQVGLEMDLAELGAVGPASLAVAVVGVALPFVGGLGVAGWSGEPPATAIFVGAALTATSVGITARVFGDLRALATAEARTVLGAAVIDDVLGLVILTVVVRMVSEGTVSVLTVAGVLGLAVGFLAVAGGLGVRLAPPLFRRVQRAARSSGTLVALALAFTLAVAQLASLARLAPIVGAFVAGLALGRSDQAERIRRDLTPVGHLFVPLFFLQIGIDADVGQLLRPAVLGLAGALLVVAVAGKLAAAVGATGAPGDKALIGLGMLPRGEVGLIFAGLGLREGVLGENLYAALLIVVLGTTLATPPLLRWRLVRVQAGPRLAAPPTAVREGGWLQVRDGEVELRGSPPAHLGLRLALQAARLVAVARPGRSLLDWFGGLAGAPLAWDAAASAELFEVLRHGNARSWRFLETTGVLDRVLPELAATFRRRRSDASELDATRVLRWVLVEQVHDLAGGADRVAAGEHARLERPDWLLLAALILDAAGDGEPVVAAARQLVKRLDLGAAAEQEVALLVGDSGLLRAVAARADGLDEASVLQLAAHLERPERARALYLLTVAQGELEPWERERLDELHRRIQSVLAHPELSGRQARNVAEQRRSAALRLVAGPVVADRLARAPRAWLINQDAPALVEQATLLDPLPDRSEPRVAVADTGEPGRWRVHVACRDRQGALARVTSSLADAGLTIADAITATWPDGGALMSFLVSGGPRPDPSTLGSRLAAAMAGPLTGRPVPDARVTFDDDASPWYTLCDVEAPDRPGLLRDLTAAMAAAGVNIHSARITTRTGVAQDRFELTDGRGEKLGEPLKQAARSELARGGAPTQRWFRRARKAATAPKHVGHSVETAAP